jgi:hypothetical protein
LTMSGSAPALSSASTVASGPRASLTIRPSGGRSRPLHQPHPDERERARIPSRTSRFPSPRRMRSGSTAGRRSTWPTCRSTDVRLGGRQREQARRQRLRTGRRPHEACRRTTLRPDAPRFVPRIRVSLHEANPGRPQIGHDRESLSAA